MTDKTSTKLKPCPFCGTYWDRLEIAKWNRPDGHIISCKRCGARGAIMDKREDAIRNWNMVPRNKDHIVDANKTVKHYHIQLRDGLEAEFDGWQRKDLDAASPNWHYYETTDGNLMHFRSEHMIGVEEGEVEYGSDRIGSDENE